VNKFIAILIARNKEFFRDRAALAWNLLFPIFLLVGFAFMFSGEGKPILKIGVLAPDTKSIQPEKDVFFSLKHIQFVPYQDQLKAVQKVDQHKIDLLVDIQNKRYWVNETNHNGYMAEQLLLAKHPDFKVSKTQGRPVRYVDWVMPGILGMNMMFSCLFGVGYVIVRYRKNGVLKRFQATPLTAFEFLSAQVVSRLLIVLALSTFLFLGLDFILDFYLLGSAWDLLVVALLGASSMIALALVIAARSASEEFTGGLLNFASWPMMFLSEVWFSLEGAPQILKDVANIFPLTHMLKAARAIITEGASLGDVQLHLWVMLAMTISFLAIGSRLFDWGNNRN